MTEDTHIISIQNVAKRFGSVTAVDNLSLDVKEGEFFALLGPSGCGKTTLLRMIAGFENPSEGDILIDERVCDCCQTDALGLADGSLLVAGHIDGTVRLWRAAVAAKDLRCPPRNPADILGSAQQGTIETGRGE